MDLLFIWPTTDISPTPTIIIEERLEQKSAEGATVQLSKHRSMYRPVNFLYKSLIARHKPIIIQKFYA